MNYDERKLRLQDLIAAAASCCQANGTQRSRTTVLSLQAGAAVVSLKRLTMFLTLDDRQDEVMPCAHARLFSAGCLVRNVPGDRHGI